MRQAVQFAVLCGLLFAALRWLATASAQAISGRLTAMANALNPWCQQKPLMTTKNGLKPDAITKRFLPIPIRDGGRAFVVTPDGSRIEVSAMTVASNAKAWAEVAGGLAVWHETNRPERMDP